jgi:hypothetical protein
LRAPLTCRAEPHPGEAAPFFIVLSGDCTTSAESTCFESPNYPTAPYANDGRCELVITADTVLLATAFVTEARYDFLCVDGRCWSGPGTDGLFFSSNTAVGQAVGPNGITVTAGATITWTSDGSVTSTGFQLCTRPDSPSPPPSPPPAPPLPLPPPWPVAPPGTP